MMLNKHIAEHYHHTGRIKEPSIHESMEHPVCGTKPPYKVPSMGKTVKRLQRWKETKRGMDIERESIVYKMSAWNFLEKDTKKLQIMNH